MFNLVFLDNLISKHFKDKWTIRIFPLQLTNQLVLFDIEIMNWSKLNNHWTVESTIKRFLLNIEFLGSVCLQLLHKESSLDIIPDVNKWWKPLF